MAWTTSPQVPMGDTKLLHIFFIGTFEEPKKYKKPCKVKKWGHESESV